MKVESGCLRLPTFSVIKVKWTIRDGFNTSYQILMNFSTIVNSYMARYYHTANTNSLFRMVGGDVTVAWMDHK